MPAASACKNCGCFLHVSCLFAEVVNHRNHFFLTLLLPNPIIRIYLGDLIIAKLDSGGRALAS